MDTTIPDLAQLDPQALRELAIGMATQLGEKGRELKYRQTCIEQLTHKMALHRSCQFGKRTEQLNSTQSSLLEEMIDADMATIEEELAHLSTKPGAADGVARKPKRALLPASLSHRAGICDIRLRPLVDALRDESLKHRVLNANETTAQIYRIRPRRKRIGVISADLLPNKLWNHQGCGVRLRAKASE